MSAKNTQHSISIHDRKAHTSRLVKMCHALGVSALDTARYVVAADKAYRRHTGTYSRYRPHQGAQECARRVRQGKAGT